MDPGTKNVLKAGGALLTLVVCGVWLVVSFSATRIGSSGNNGSSIAMPTPPAGTMKMMEKVMEHSEGFKDQDWSDPAVRARSQMEMMKAMSGEDREAVREMFADMQRQMDMMQRALGPEQTRQMMDRMRERMPQMMEEIRKRNAGTPESKGAR